MAVLELEQVSCTYAAGTPFEKAALHEVSLSIEQGDFIGIIGHTGSGKSTLIQQMNGLIRPTAGRVLLNGRDIWENPKKIRDVRFQVGMVFQYPEHQLFEDTVYKDIAFGPRNMGLSEGEIDERVKAAAEWADIREEWLQKSPFDLSGGQKRRVAIAGVIAMQPKVLILDEPTAGLDPKGRERLLERIAAYHRDHQTTVLLVSHSMEDVARIAQKVLVMSEGRPVMFDTTDRVFSRAEELERIGLTVPAVTRICMELRRRGLYTGNNAYTVEQAVKLLSPHLKRGDGRA